MTASPSRRLLATLAALSVAVTLGGCKVHLDTAPSPFEALSSADVARYRAAVCDEQVATAFEAATGDAAQVDTLHGIAERARARLVALGEPWPFADSERVPVPAPPSAPPAPADPAAALSTLATCAALARVDAGALDDPDLAPMLASAAIARGSEVEAAAAALGITAPQGEPVEASGPLVWDRETGAYRSPDEGDSGREASASPTATTDLTDAIRGLDEARYRLEQAAAGLSDAEKAQALQVTDLLASQMADLARVPDSDPREPAYGRIDLTDAPARAHEALDEALTEEYRLVAIGPEAARDGVFEPAAALWRLALTWGETPSPFAGLDVSGEATPTPSQTTR